MNVTKLSEEAKNSLIGREIISVGDNYLVLDNGCRIYLDESEIESLN
jgi:hypothetical protein